MDPLILALLGFCAMMLLIALHVPIGISMALVGVTGFAQVVGWGPASVAHGQRTCLGDG